MGRTGKLSRQLRRIATRELHKRTTGELVRIADYRESRRFFDAERQALKVIRKRARRARLIGRIKSFFRRTFGALFGAKQ